MILGGRVGIDIKEGVGGTGLIHMNMPFWQRTSQGEDMLIYPPSPLPLEKEGGIFTNEILLLGAFSEEVSGEYEK